MGEKRAQPREELVAAMICTIELGSVSTHCLIRNVSVEGALLECPLAENYDNLEIGDPAILGDILKGSKALFEDTTGEIAWLYKRFIGLHFDQPIMGSVDELREWLESQNLV